MQPYVFTPKKILRAYWSGDQRMREALTIYFVTNYCCIYSYVDFILKSDEEAVVQSNKFEEYLKQCPPNCVWQWDDESYMLNRMYDACLQINMNSYVVLLSV